MLNVMRKNAGSWMIKVLLIAIVIVFIFWGVGSFRDQQGGRVALVNGQTITYDEYLKTYSSMVENLKLRFGENLNDDMIKMLNVKQEALNQLINSQLLMEEALRLKFDVSKEKLAEAIRNMEVFHSNGSFDKRLYERVLSHYQRSPEEFETLQKKTMMIDQLKNFVYGTVKVSDQEALEWYQWNHASVKIDYALFEPDKYKGIQPTEEEINRYFEEHKTSYKTEPRVKVRYVMIDPDAFKQKAAIKDEEVAEYFEDNSEEFIVPKTVEARHILIRMPQDAVAEIVEEKRIKAVEITNLAKKGKEFSELAKTYSEGPDKAEGGYLGTFKFGDMIAPFSERAFSMKAGEISEPVRTQFGWHVIKVEKVNAERKKTFKEAEKDIREKLIEKFSDQAAYAEAESVYDQSFDVSDLSQIAEKKHLKLTTTDFFPKTGPAKGITQPAKFASTAFDLEMMEISDVLPLDGKYYIIQLIDKMEEKIPGIKEVREKVNADVVGNKQREAAEKEARGFLERLKKQTADQGKKADVQFHTSAFFKRFDPIPDVGYEKEIIDTAFTLSKDNPYPENVVKGSKGYYVIRLKDRIIPDPAGFKNEKSEIEKKLLEQKQAKAFNALVTQLRKKSEISIKQGFLSKT
jgi:peptidyl-prolyl cis-trans isomerase D